MIHVRDLPDMYFGKHDEAEDPTCTGTRCPACDCCMHCSEKGCTCSVGSCGCADWNNE